MLCELLLSLFIILCCCVWKKINNKNQLFFLSRIREKNCSFAGKQDTTQEDGEKLNMPRCVIGESERNGVTPHCPALKIKSFTPESTAELQTNWSRFSTTNLRGLMLASKHGYSHNSLFCLQRNKRNGCIGGIFQRAMLNILPRVLYALRLLLCMITQ